MEYFKVVLEAYHRWGISVRKEFPNGDPVDIWAYSRGQILDNPRPVPIEVGAGGPIVDYNPTAFCTTVVSHRTAEIITSVAGSDIQRIPTDFPDGDGEWEVINVLPTIDCIDHERSVIQYYPPDHPEKPNKPRGVVKLIIDRDRVGGHHIFRPKDWTVINIISETLRQRLDEAKVTGVEYWPVTEPGK